jgi:V/A-type H+-transporting ATPase subunit F
MELAVVGSPEFVLGFKLAGIRKTYGVPHDQLVSKITEVLEDKSVGILVIHDSDMRLLPAPLRLRLDASVEPVVISIGKIEEVELREKIKRAVGVDLWKK